MTKPPRQPDPSGFRPEDQFDDVFAYGNPNPDRIGCPSPEALRALSRRERPIDDPGYEHISNCSPCFREFRALQQGQAAQRARRRLWSVVTAAAAVVLIGVITAWVLVAPREGVRPAEVAPTGQAAELDTVLDLQQYTVTRGEHAAAQPPALTLASARHKLTVLLPVGAEPGPYDVRIVASNQQSVASASGRAHIQNYVTTLETRLDASSIRPGEYQLALRHEGDDWHVYPISVR